MDLPQERGDRLDLLEEAVGELRATVARLGERLAVLERAGAVGGGEEDQRVSALRSPAAPEEAGAPAAVEAAAQGISDTAAAPAPAAAAEGAAEEGEHAGRELLGDLGLLGRTLMVLGGAFLLRAVTETDALPDAAGVALGFAYALVWLVLAYRAAERTDHSAAFHALAYTLIAFPLVVEAVLRFAVLTPTTAAVAMAVLAGLGLLVAAQRRLRSAAWFVSLGAVGAASLLLMADGRRVPDVVVLLLVGTATLQLSYLRPWRLLPWLTAAAADLAVLVPAIMLAFERWQGSPYTVLGLQLVAVALYLGSFAVRSRRPGWKPRLFEMLQTAAVLAVAWGGALWVAGLVPSTARTVALVGLALALASFAAAAGMARHRREHRPAFLYYAAVGCPLLLGGSALLLSSPAEALLWAALTVIVGLVSVRASSVTLALVATVFALAAAVTSGLLTHAVHSHAAPASVAWPGLGIPALVVLAAVVATALLPYPRRSAFWRGAAVLPGLVLTVLIALGVGSLVTELAAPLVAGTPGGDVDAGALAALRTAVLAVLAVLAATAGQWQRLRTARWLVYPLLGLGALKMLVEDLPHGRPTTLFAGLAVYGAALIAAPRLLRQRPDADRGD